jgi:hypothetical protein
MPRSRRSGLPDHLDLAIAHAFHVGYKPGDPMPLGDDDPVPGCNCEHCTGLAPRPILAPARESFRAERFETLDVDGARAVPMLDVAEHLGIRELKRNGKSYRGPCPIHQGDGPNFSVNPERGLFHCFVCGEGGDAIRLVERVRGCSFPEAVRELTQMAA